MLADHAARVFARSACLGAEAWSACSDADGKLRLVGDVLAHEIGERHFGGGDEPASLELHVLGQLLLEVFTERVSIADLR